MGLCEFSIDQNWQLIYKASQDGFKSFNFDHLIKSENGNVFGGYTEKSWACNTCHGNYKFNSSSFLFSFVNLKKNKLKMKNDTPMYSIFCSITYGPTFGGGNENENSFSNLGYFFPHPDYEFRSEQANRNRKNIF